MNDEEDAADNGLGSVQSKEARATPRQRLLIFLKWAKAELLGFFLLFATGITLGMVLPVNPNLTEPYARISNCVGYVYFLAWTVSFYPQIFENYHRGTTIGLSLDFQIFNLIGFCCYSAFSLSFMYSRSIQDEYASRHHGNHNKVETQDVLFAVHAVAITLVTIAQICYYDGRQQRLTLPSGLLMAAMLLSMGVYAALVASAEEEEASPPQWRTWYNWLYFVSYVKLLISTVKGIPQLVVNYQRRSTEGWNIHNVLLDATGGSLSILQLLLDCYDTKDWSGILGSPVKFGLGFVSLLFDVVFSLQHFVWYRDPKKELGFHLYGLIGDGGEEDGGGALAAESKRGPTAEKVC